MASIYSTPYVLTAVNKSAAVVSKCPKAMSEASTKPVVRKTLGKRMLLVAAKNGQEERAIYRWAQRQEDGFLDKQQLVNGILQEFNLPWPKVCVMVNRWVRLRIISRKRNSIIFTPNPKLIN